MPREIPKIIHVVWIGGGDLTKVKDLEGIRSYLRTNPSYEVWLWWDHSHVFNMHGVRKALNLPLEEQEQRAAFRTVYQEPAPDAGEDYPQPERGPGQDHRSFQLLQRILSADAPIPAGLQDFFQEFVDYWERQYSPGGLFEGSERPPLGVFMKSEEQKGRRETLLALFLLHKANDAMAPLREAAGKSDGRLVLRDVAELTAEMNWLNWDSYNKELGFRGIFPAAASDILRYEILYNYGGIYMDVDLQLTASLDQLSVGENLALCAFEDFHGVDRADGANQIYHKGSHKTHGDHPFYAMNNIVATHPQSCFADTLRLAIKQAYQEMEAQPDGPLRSYWEQVPNKSTIDLTGPNLVREVLYQCFLGTPQNEMAQHCVERLRSATPHFLKNDRDSTKAALKALDPQQKGTPVDEPFARSATVWDDSDPRHFGFWNWVWENAYFPMHKVNWQTEAAAKSDTKAAGKQ